MKFELNTGRRVPGIGFGTWNLQPDGVAQAAVTAALQAGYRVIDTASIYDNEQAVGTAIKESGLARDEVFVTSKLWNSDQGYDRTLRACADTLERLRLDYLDLYLIHWPASPKRSSSWRALERLHDEGVIKAAGVSNYTVEHLEELLADSQLKPATNQIEFHIFIYEQQRAVLEFCQQNDILVQAYSPLSRSQHGVPEVVEEIAVQHSKTAQQVLLRWCQQHQTMPLPRSSSPAHIRQNFDISGFDISDEEMLQLDGLSDGQRVTWDPAGMGQARD